MHVIYVEGVRYLWDELTKRLSLDGELVALAANSTRARELAALHRRRSVLA